jgi:PilZ domain
MVEKPMSASFRPAALTPIERRRYPRYAFTAAVQAVDTAQRCVLNARISDLSRGGCYIDSFSPFPLKTAVKLRITSEKRAFEAHAKVVYSRTGMGMGLAFSSVEKEQSHVLDQWIGELSGAAPAELPAMEGNGSGAGKDRSHDEQCFALMEHTISLIRKGGLSNEQGKIMLRNLLGQEPEP